MSASELKVLLWDIESAPLLAYIWRPSDDYVPHDRMIQDTFILCWSAKWYRDKKVHSGVLTSDEARNQDDSRIVKELADMIREADILVAHNGDQFDVPMFNNRLLALGHEPIGPKKTIDTCKLAKKNFRMAYNKLDYLGEVLGLGRKLKTDFDLWKGCYHGNRKALNKMRQYNIQDVWLLEAVYAALLPYVKNVPRLTIPQFHGEHACPFCGMDTLVRRGTHHTNVSSYQRFQCSACLKYCRSRNADKLHYTVAPL